MFGNIANTHYQIAKALRAHSDLDVHLYVDEGHHPAMLPESDDPAGFERYPPWIHKGNYLGPGRYLFPWTSPLIRELAQFDLVIASGEGPIFAQFCGIPWCFYVSGSDLTMLPFIRRFWSRHRGARAKAANIALAMWQRRAIRRASEIWSQPFQPFRDALTRLGVSAARVAPEYFPVVIDTQLFSADSTVGTPFAIDLRRDHDFVVFHPSRLMISAESALREAGQWKQNDLLIRAFARFVRKGLARTPVLLIPDRGDSPDVAVARVLIAQLDIGSHVVWLRPPRLSGYTRGEMVSFYRIADVVADDFGAGWFGAVALEALAMERPVVTYLDQVAMRMLYPWHPMLSASTEDELVDLLTRLYAAPDLRRDVGRRGRAWIEEFHREEAAAARYVRNVRSATTRLGL